MNEIPAKFDYKSSENKWRVYWESNEIYKSVVNKKDIHGNEIKTDTLGSRTIHYVPDYQK